MVKIRFMGGTHEVGRNAVLLESGEARLLLDYGVKVGEKPEFPGHVRSKDIDGIVLTHAHLDHSGGVPLFYLSESKPLFATPVTTEITKVLMKDMIKLSGYFLPFEYIEFDAMLRQRKDLGYGERVRVGDVEFAFTNAGHIQGSSMVELETGGKRILYTGDINTLDTRVVHGAKIPQKPFDAVIIESTYATTEHEDRTEIEALFVASIKEVVGKGGKVLVPAFAVGRSQEMLSVLHAHKLRANTVIDGMARAVNQITLDYPDYVRNPKTLMKVISDTKEVQGWRDRREALRRADVMVAPSGMLQGGSALYYMEKLALDERNAIFLVSYQIPGTNGAKLLETKSFEINEAEQEVKAQVRRFDFSSHCGKSQLEDFLRGLNGKPDVYVLHGEPENCDALAQFARDVLDLDAVAPDEGDEFKV